MSPLRHVSLRLPTLGRVTRPEQTEFELKSVCRLARDVAEFTEHDVALSPEDPPDVIASGIGVEVTEFHRTRGDLELIPIEKEQVRVTQAAWEHYKRSGGVPQHVSIRFVEKPLPRRGRSLIARGLADVALDRMTRAASKLRLRGQELPGDLSTHVRWIHMERPGGDWNCLGGGSVEGDWAAIEPRVRTKEDDLSSWPASVARRWLLVVAPAVERVDGMDSMLFSSMFPHAGALPATQTESRFERVYFLDVMTDQVTRVT